MSQQDAALGHHLDQVTGTELESEIPSHTQNDEQILCRGRFRHPGSYRGIPSLSTVCTRTLRDSSLFAIQGTIV
jgi:hypothetical protein